MVSDGRSRIDLMLMSRLIVKQIKGQFRYPTKQAAMRSESASRFSTSMGAAMAAEASKAPSATACKENFIVRGEERSGGEWKGKEGGE